MKKLAIDDGIDTIKKSRELIPVLESIKNKKMVNNGFNFKI